MWERLHVSQVSRVFWVSRRKRGIRRSAHNFACACHAGLGLTQIYRIYKIDNEIEIHWSQII